MATMAPPKSRLSADKRRLQILESAKALILERGIAACTLEEVAAEADISKSLMYRHFSSRDELLAALLNQEYRALRGGGVSDVPADISFATLAASANLRTFDYYLTHGPIVRILLSDPGVSALLGPRDRTERHGVNRYFSRHIEKTYNLPPDLSALGAFLMLNAATNSGGALTRFGIDSRKASEFWTTFVLAGFAAVAARYGARPEKKPTKTPKKR